MNTTAVIIDEDAKRKANIRVLQRIDANINDVLGSATHVVLYEFRAASQSWEKKDCEGAVFVCKASGVPRFRMIILNRVASDNLVVNITEKFQLQDRDPYLIFRQQDPSDSLKDKIMGIWFHEGKERENISNVLRQVIRSYTEVKAEDTSTHDTSTSEKINYNQAVSNLLSSLRIGANTAEEKETVTPSQSKVQQTEQRTDTKESAVLDKKSLQLALLSLLQDDRFIDIIHGQYLKVVQVRSAKSQQNERDKK